MVIFAMSALDAQNETLKTVNHKTAIISITDTNKPKAYLHPQPWLKAILRLQFDDVVTESEDKRCIKAEDAHKIKEFVEKYKDSVDRIIVHCKAGTSRSPGIAAAIINVLDGDDMPIFSNREYFPNMKCYREVLRAFLGTIDEDAVCRRERINRLLWIP
jgi:predicted protein tyrosine phosphatase